MNIHKLSAILAIFALLLSVAAVNAAGTFSGRGDDLTRAFELNEGIAIFGFEHDGDSNFIVWLYNAETGEQEELLANEIGEYSGKTMVAVKDDEILAVDTGKHQLNVEADGNWKITLEQPTEVSGRGLPQTFGGKGDDVVGPVELKKGSVKFEGTHKGSGNFIVELHESNGRDWELVFNEIGSYEGKQLVSVGTGILAIPSGNYYISVVGDDWTVKVTQEVKLEPTPEITPEPTPSPSPTPTAFPSLTPTPTPTPTPLVAPSPSPAAPTPTPTPPAPGFEAIFAIAGLLAVAYLVRRRK
ncbi:MAG: PGF-CTERM sorting domain-containing protein [Halobacteriota archaeon]